MEQPAHHEVVFVRAFLARSKQKRVLGLLSKETGRSKFRGSLAHFRSLWNVGAREYV
jgi:hypothetical protein